MERVPSKRTLQTNKRPAVNAGTPTKVKAVPAKTSNQKAQVQRALEVKKPESKTKGVRNPLPSAPVLKGLKAPGNATKDQIHSRLKKKSPWYTSIADPLRGADAKIPDETGVETGTLQLVERYFVESTSSGIAGLKVLSPYVNNVNLGDPNGSNVQVATGSDVTIAWADVNGNPGKATPFTGVNELKAITNQHRIVSAALYVQPESSLSTNQGEMTMFISPFIDSVSPLYSTYLNLYKSSSIPLNSNKAGAAMWYPTARQDWSFKSFIRTIGDAFTEDDIGAGSVPYWNIGFMASGLDTSTTVSFRVTVVVNYEFVPIYNTLNVIQVSPSPQDAMETDLVETWVQDMPTTRAIPQTQASVAPSTVTPNHEDDSTGFGMFFNVLGELVPLAAAMLL